MSGFGGPLFFQFLLLGFFLVEFLILFFFPGSFSFLFLGSISFHLLELNFFIEAELFEESSEDILVDDDGLSVFFIETHPNFKPIAGRVVDFGRDEAEPVDFVTPFEVLPQKEKSKLLVNLLLIRLSLGDLKNEPASVLIAFIFPLGLDPLAEVLDGVDSFLGVSHLVATWSRYYAFCLLFGLRK